MTIQDARAAVGKLLGISRFDGSVADYAGLSQADQVRVSDGLAAYIVANPGAFSAEQYSSAKKTTMNPGFNSPLSDTSFDFGLFGDEVLNNAEKITEKGGSILQNVIYLAAVAGLLAYLLPTFLTRYQKGRASIAKPPTD